MAICDWLCKKPFTFTYFTHLHKITIKSTNLKFLVLKELENFSNGNESSTMSH